MAKYRAIVSLEFDDDDIAEFAENVGVDPDRVDPYEWVSGCLDDLPFSPWVEQVFKDGRETVLRLSGGILVEVNDHDD